MSSERMGSAVDGPADEPWFIREVRLQREASQRGADMPADRLQADRPVTRDAATWVEAHDDPGKVPPRRSSIWPYAAGAAAVLAVGGGLLFAPGHDDDAKPGAPPATRARAVPPATVLPSASDPISTADPVSRCATPAIIEDLRAAVGARAREAGAADARQLRANMARLSISGGEPLPAAAAPGLEACVARLSLWLPSGDGTLREIAATATYAVDLRAGGNGRVDTVEGIGELIAQLSAPPMASPVVMAAAIPAPGVARPTTQPGLVRPAAVAAVAPPPPAIVEAPPRARPAPIAAPAEPREATSTDTRGGGDRCDNARTRAEYLVCSNSRLAALDDEVAALLAGIEANADPTTASVARDDQTRFLRSRDRCAEPSCVTRVYRRRILDLRDFGYPRG